MAAADDVAGAFVLLVEVVPVLLLLLLLCSDALAAAAAATALLLDVVKGRYMDRLLPLIPPPVPLLLPRFLPWDEDAEDFGITAT